MYQNTTHEDMEKQDWEWGFREGELTMVGGKQVYEEADCKLSPEDGCECGNHPQHD